MHKPYTSEPIRRLEEELAAHLAPVSAPDELWERVEARMVRRSGAAWTPAWGLAASLVVAVAAGVVWVGYARVQSARALAEMAVAAHTELSRHPERLDLHTNSAAVLRQWVAENSPLTAAVALERPQPDPDGLQLVGAQWIPFGRMRMAAIAYRLGIYPATLLIAPDTGKGEASSHPVVHAEDRDGLKLYSWHMKGQVYTLVSGLPDQSQRACVLCHADPPQRQMILRMKFAG